MKIIAARLLQFQTSALEHHYSGNRLDGYIAKVLAFALMGCISILFCLFGFYLMVDTDILDLASRMAFLPVIAVVSVFLLFTYHKLLRGQLHTSRIYFSIAFIVGPVVAILITGGFPQSDATPLMVLPPIVMFLLYGMRTGLAFSILIPIAAFAQWAIFDKFGNPIHDFTSSASPIANILIAGTFTYAIALLVIAAFQYQNHILRIELEKMATRDELTGLVNRRHFLENLEIFEKNAIANNTKFSVIYVDLDKFKPINDRHGHKIGDAVLQKVAKRLRLCFRDSNIVARVGGDEFAIIFAGDVSEQALLKKEDQLRRELQFPISAGNQLHQIGASIGSSVFPDTTENIQLLLDAADKAMYRNKSDNKVEITSENLVQSDEDLIAVETFYFEKSA